MKVIVISDFRPFKFPSNNSFALIELTVTNHTHCMILINPEKILLKALGIDVI